MARNNRREPQRQEHRGHEDTRTPEGLLDPIDEKGKEVAEALAELRRLSTPR